jgi:hypothetical protein
VIFNGNLAPNGTEEYQPLQDLLEKVLATRPGALTLDMRALTGANDAGINVSYKFAISTRKQGEVKLKVLRSATALAP